MEGLSARPQLDAHGRTAVAGCRRLGAAIWPAIVSMFRNDGGNIAQSAAYSAIFAIFPALIVAAATLTALPDVNSFKIEAAEFFNEVLPETVVPMLNGYFVKSHDIADAHPIRTVVFAALVTLTAGSSTLAIVMQGLGRAAGALPGAWSFWQMRRRALLLVPLSLVPLGVASVLVVFGRFISDWLMDYMTLSVRPAAMAVAFVLRWTISLGGVAALTALIYHLGVPGSSNRVWQRALPGAILATLLWFVSTLGFGLYVTRVANYSAVYGSLGAGIALLIWLFLVFLSVLIGAEFNAQLQPQSN